ncbi:MAG: NusA N-terminal domain-containing protein [Deltaproteobacteria bacterium]|nr:NusA N-terminal domain-containing protein [Deltaproteobacteria bacterium]
MSEESIETFKLNIVLDTLSKEKSLDKEVLIAALKQAVLAAARKKLGLTADLEARYDTAATMEEVMQRDGQYAVLAKMKEGEKKEAAGLVRIYQWKKVVKDVNNHTLEISLIDARQQMDPDLTDEDIGIDLGTEVWSKDFGEAVRVFAHSPAIQVSP